MHALGEGPNFTQFQIQKEASISALVWKAASGSYMIIQGKLKEQSYQGKMFQHEIMHPISALT